MCVTRLDRYAGSVDKQRKSVTFPLLFSISIITSSFQELRLCDRHHGETASSDCLRLLNTSERPELNNVHLSSVPADVVVELLVAVERLAGQLEIVMELHMFVLCDLAAISRVTIASASLFKGPSSRAARYVPRTWPQCMAHVKKDKNKGRSDDTVAAGTRRIKADSSVEFLDAQQEALSLGSVEERARLGRT